MRWLLKVIIFPNNSNSNAHGFHTGAHINFLELMAPLMYWAAGLALASLLAPDTDTCMCCNGYKHAAARWVAFVKAQLPAVMWRY